MAAVQQQTEFLPSRNGFAFANAFPHVPAKEIDLVVTKVPLGDASNGLCGGMVYAALDYFVAQRPLPPNDPPAADGTIPAPGSGPLFDYLVDRLLDSWKADGLNGCPAGVTYYHLMSSTVPDEERFWTRFSPWHSRAWVMAKDAWPKVKGDIDAGRPSPLGLIRVLTWDPMQIGHHHQVLVWGYSLDGSALSLNIYDPNMPGRDDVALQLDISSLRHKIVVSRTPPSSWPIHCFFRPGYSPRQPPA
jgi:hypothetical protein